MRYKQTFYPATMDQTDRILSLAQLMFGFFGLIIAAASILGGVLAWSLRKSAKEAVEVGKQAEKNFN